jgi:succinate dehydrogenase / fumarate reductase iron-sulfur subunit
MRTLPDDHTPPFGLPVVRDPIVDMTQFFKQYNSIKPYLINDNVPPERALAKFRRAMSSMAFTNAFVR